MYSLILGGHFSNLVWLSFVAVGTVCPIHAEAAQISVEQIYDSRLYFLMIFALLMMESS